MKNQTKVPIIFALVNAILVAVVIDIILSNNEKIILMYESLYIATVLAADFLYIMVTLASRVPDNVCDYCKFEKNQSELITNDILYPHGRVCNDCVDRAEEYDEELIK